MIKNDKFLEVIMEEEFIAATGVVNKENIVDLSCYLIHCLMHDYEKCDMPFFEEELLNDICEDIKKCVINDLYDIEVDVVEKEGAEENE